MSGTLIDDLYRKEESCTESSASARTAAGSGRPSGSLRAFLSKLRDPDPRNRYSRGDWAFILTIGVGPIIVAVVFTWLVER